MLLTTINFSLRGLVLLFLIPFISTLNGQVWSTHVDLAPLDCPIEIELINTIFTCEGADVCVSITGGTPPYTFTLNGQDQNNSETGLNVCFQDLQPGAYTLTVSDIEGCSQSLDIDIPFVDYFLNANVTDVSCFGGSDGAIQLEILIDLAPLFYSWEGPNGYTQELQDIEKVENLEAGLYSVSVTSIDNYCVGIGSWEVEEPDPLELEIAITTPACGQPDVCVFVSGGTPPYQIWAFQQLPPLLSNSQHGQLGALTDLNPGNAIPLFQTASNTAFCAQNVPNGTYYILAFDANFCYRWEVITIEANGILERTLTTSHVSCHGAADGSICFAIHSGTPPYVTTLSPNTDNLVILGPEGCFNHLGPGEYVITSTDASGCSISETVFIHEPDTLAASFEITSPPCSDQIDGCLMVEGGTMPFQIYVWEWPDPTIDVLPPVDFTSTGPVIVDANPVDYILFDGDPVAPYIRCAEDIPAGFYLVLIVDANGCYTLIPVHIPSSNGLETSFGITSSECDDGVSGCLTVQGGTPPYRIWVWRWDSSTDVIPTVEFNDNGEPHINGAQLTDAVHFGPENTTDFTRCADHIPPGYYLVLTVDSNGCYDLLPVYIPDSKPLEADFEITSPACSDQVDGCLSVSGGTTPYHIWVWHWPNPTTDVLPTVHFDDNGEPQIDQASPTDAFDFVADPTTPNYYLCAEDIPAGFYLVLVVDANGCYVLLPVNIPEPNSLGLHVESRDVRCFGDENGKIKLSITGGEAPYTVSINGVNVPQSDEHVIIFEDLAPGVYIIDVADANQCTGTVSVEINEPDPLDIHLDFDPFGSYACADPTGGVPPYHFRWFNLETNAVISHEACVENLNVGVYLVVVIDAHDCQTAELLFIDEQPCLGGEASVNPEVISSGEYTTFTLSNYSGMNIQWQFKTEVTPWLNIPGATTEVYQTPPINTASDKIILVRAVVYCQNGEVMYSTETEFKVEGSNLLIPYAALQEDIRLFDQSFRQKELKQLAQQLQENPKLVRVYPTLSNDIIYVQFEQEQSEPVVISLINSMGQTIFTQVVDEIYRGESLEIPVQTMPTGTYFVHFSGDVGQTERIVVFR